MDIQTKKAIFQCLESCGTWISGDSNKEARQYIMQLLGYKLPKSKCGTTAVLTELFDVAAVKTHIYDIQGMDQLYVFLRTGWDKELGTFLDSINRKGKFRTRSILENATDCHCVAFVVK